jgi:ribosomal protein L30E
MSIDDEIRESVKNNKVVIGANATIKKLKIGKISKVILSTNCAKDLTSEINHLAKISNVKVILSKHTNEELGVLCRKQFKISTLGIKND